MLYASPECLPYQQRALAQLDGLIGWIEGDLAQRRGREAAGAVASSIDDGLDLAEGRLELLRQSREVLVSEFPDGTSPHH